MARIKISVYVTPDVADTLKRVAAIEDRSVSDIIEDAVVRRLAGNGRDAEHAAIMAKLDKVMRRVGVIEKAQETHFEFSAQTARFLLSVAPEIPAADRPALTARGADRFRNIMSFVVSKLASGASSLQEAASAPTPASTAARMEAAE